MKAEKDPKTGKWLIQYRYTDWQGVHRKSTKRGFRTKREAEGWLRDFISQKSGNCDMKFNDFTSLYLQDMRTRLREITISRKQYIINLKLDPYFGNKNLNSITAPDIRAWQNEMIRRGYSPTYLRGINGELNTIFNYAVKYYDLPANPCKKAGTIGSGRAMEVDFWTREEFECFIESMMKKRDSYLSFMLLYWTGMRLGELLALTVGDVDLENKTITINKSLQRLNGRDVITLPKTKKSIRTISIPRFLVEDIADYLLCTGKKEASERLLSVSKAVLEREIQRGIKESGVKKIHIHGLRHSNCALLASLGFSPAEVAERLGHENIKTTLNIYTHVMPDRRNEVADRLDQFYREGIV